MVDPIALVRPTGAAFFALAIGASLMPAIGAAAPPPSPRIDDAAALSIRREARDAGVDRSFGTLEARDDGGFDYVDPKGRFTAMIRPDGRVEFTSAPPVQTGVCFSLVGCIPVTALDQFLVDASRWQAPPRANQEAAAAHGGVDLSVPRPQNYALGWVPGGDMPTPLSVSFGGSFGPPLLTPRIRAEFLGQTFELRLGLAARAERARLGAALTVLEDRLMKVWSDPAKTLAKRRELLFELWDECLDGILPPLGDDVDDLGASLEEARQRAASEGRRRILQFIRAWAPAGSSLAYTDDELRRFNARRRSRERFAPYEAAASP